MQSVTIGERVGAALTLAGASGLFVVLIIAPVVQVFS